MEKPPVQLIKYDEAPKNIPLFKLIYAAEARSKGLLNQLPPLNEEEKKETVLPKHEEN